MIFNDLLLQVQYWQVDCERGEDLYELTVQKFKSDLRKSGSETYQ